MNFKYCVCSIILIYYFNLVYANETTTTTGPIVTYKITDQVLLCSQYLSSVINNLCEKVIKIVKRDTSSILLDKLVPKELQEHLNSRKLLTDERWSRIRRQVASECCDRPCTIANIIRYCPDDAKLVREDPDVFDY